MTGRDNSLVAVHTDFFPPELLAGLVADVNRSNVRKRTWRLDRDEVPAVIAAAAELAATRLELSFNFALLKWYRAPESSAAYDTHVDPPNLRTIPLVLCTLTGAADLEIFVPSGPAIIRCETNTTVVLHPDLPHRVSPPVPAGSERYLLFLGFESDEHA